MGDFSDSWTATQPPVICPVLTGVVSKTIPQEQSIQFHSSNKFIVALAIRSPAFPWGFCGIAGTPRSLVPPIPDIKIGNLSSFVILVFKVFISLPSQ